MDGDGAAVFHGGEWDFLFVQVNGGGRVELEAMLPGVGFGEQEGLFAGFLDGADEAFVPGLGAAEGLGNDEGNGAESAERSLNETGFVRHKNSVSGKLPGVSF